MQCKCKSRLLLDLFFLPPLSIILQTLQYCLLNNFRNPPASFKQPQPRKRNIIRDVNNLDFNLIFYISECTAQFKFWCSSKKIARECGVSLIMIAEYRCMYIDLYSFLLLKVTAYCRKIKFGVPKWPAQQCKWVQDQWCTSPKIAKICNVNMLLSFMMNRPNVSFLFDIDDFMVSESQL